MTTQHKAKAPYAMQFDAGTVKHLGLQLYSTLPPVIGELVANGWDANASLVEITIPETPLDPITSEIVIYDDGIGMSDQDVRTKYVITGRDRRESESTDESPVPLKRKLMGRKGIGKFSSFGIAKEIEIESVKDGETSRFVMNYDQMMAQSAERSIEFEALPATGTISQGTKITLRRFTKFNTRRIQIDPLRRRLARRFSILGPRHGFKVAINGSCITPEERDLQALLDTDAEGERYIWEYDNVKLCDSENWTVSGWIGTLDRTTPNIDGIDRGIALMARGKLVQEPFVFDAVVGQQYALSYIIGELHVEFVDETEDTISTNRNALVWDTEANEVLKKWGQDEVNSIARKWAAKRSTDNQKKLEQHHLYQDFKHRASETGNRRAMKIVDQMVRQTISKNPVAEFKELEPIIQTSLDFLEFNAFWEIATDLTEADLDNVDTILNLFHEWQVVEAKEMARVLEGRITTIEKLQDLIKNNALEVPTLHNFLKEFPWVIDPRWTLVDDEVRYSDILRQKFPEPENQLAKDRRIDFLCVREGNRLSVVEIKRPGATASKKELDQIEAYTGFLRNHVKQTTDPDFRVEDVIGYLLCGHVADSPETRWRRDHLERAAIYVRLYSDLLDTVHRLHKEFIERYNKLKEIKSGNTP